MRAMMMVALVWVFLGWPLHAQEAAPLRVEVVAWVEGVTAYAVCPVVDDRADGLSGEAARVYVEAVATAPGYIDHPARSRAIRCGTSVASNNMTWCAGDGCNRGPAVREFRSVRYVRVHYVSPYTGISVSRVTAIQPD